MRHISIDVHRLSNDEYRACCTDPMADITATATAVVDVWSYIEAIDLDALALPKLHDVRHVYRDGAGRYDHVLIGTGRFNTLLVIVVDLRKASVRGHFVLDLNEIYGADGGHLKLVQ